MSISTSPALRCPRCSAQVFAGSDWCTLCYADLRPAPPEPVQLPIEPIPASVSDETPSQSRPRGKHARMDPAGAADDEAARPPTPPEVAALADRMLAELAAAESANPLGAWARVLDSRGKKVAFAVSVAIAATTVFLLLMMGLGTLL